MVASGNSQFKSIKVRLLSIKYDHTFIIALNIFKVPIMLILTDHLSSFLMLFIYCSYIVRILFEYIWINEK